MPTIVTLHDPLGINTRNVEEVKAGTLLLGFLIDAYGPDGFDIPTKVYKDLVADDSEIYLSDHTNTGYPLADGDIIIICRTPQGVEAIFFIIAFVIALALAPSPRVPSFEKTKTSPNNSLTGQTNVARLQERIPDIYGKNKVFPDLIAVSYFEFINDTKYLTEYLCIGRGEFLVEEIKSGETLISDIPQSTATVYQPFTRPVSLLAASESSSVNGQEVPAPNEIKMNAFTADIKFTANDAFSGDSSTMAAFNDLIVGDTFSISGASEGLTTTRFTSFLGDTMTTGSSYPSGFVAGVIITLTGTASNDGQYEIASRTSATFKCIDVVTGAPVSFTTEASVSTLIEAIFDNNGTYTLASFTVIEDLINSPPDPTEYEITVDETTFGFVANAPLTTIQTTTTKDNFIGPFAVPGNPDQVWFNIEFTQGLTNNGNYTTVQVNLQLQEVDSGGSPIGSAEDNYINYTDDTVDPRRFTTKTIPLNPGGLYTAKVFRITNKGSATDAAKWTALTGMGNVTATDFGDVTTVLITTEATDQATKQQNREFNAVVTRKLVTYSGGSITGTKLPTARMADAMLDILTDGSMGNKPAAQIDLDALYAIQDRLDTDPIYGDTLGRFCYTLSDQATPVADEILTCANSCRLFVTRAGDNIRFGRDEAQASRVTLFNTRNKNPNSEKKTVSMQKQNDNDGILLEWSDESTGESGTIIMPESATPLNPKKIKTAGIRNYDQAWNRAKFEYLRLVYQRRRVNTQVTADGLLVSIGDRVANQDGTLIIAQAGEITGIDGLNATCSERLDFKGFPSGTVILRDDNGAVSSPVSVTAGTNENEMILASLPFPITIRGDLNYQVGTLYTFSPNSDHTAEDFMINTIQPQSNGYVGLTLTNYAEEVYGPDTETPTPL